MKMIEQQLDSLLEDIKYEISLLSNAAAFIFETFDDILEYFYKNNN